MPLLLYGNKGWYNRKTLLRFLAANVNISVGGVNMKERK